jgi:hypothetical protein
MATAPYHTVGDLVPLGFPEALRRSELVGLDFEDRAKKVYDRKKRQ